MGTLYGDGSDHGQDRRQPGSAALTDADLAAARAARFRRETRVDTRTDADRGTEKLTVRLAPGYKARLRALAESDGNPIAVWIEMWVQAAERELAELGKRKPRR